MTSPKPKNGSPPATDTKALIRKLRATPLPYLAGLLVLVLILFGSFLFSNKMLYGSDQIAGLDSKVLLKESITQFGQFPMWLSTRLGGMPSLDASFGDALYPPSIALTYLFPVHRMLGLKLVLHVLLAGLLFYLMLVKGFGCSRLVGFVGAAFYMLSPQFVSHVYPGHDAKMFVIAWLPFIVWRMKTLMESPGPLNASLLALGIAIALFTNHPQMTYYMLWGLFLYWVFSLVMQWREHRTLKRLLAPGLWFWGAVFVGVGMAFVQLYPTYQFVRDAHSVRGVDRGMEFAASWSMHWPELFSLWVPEFGNHLDYYWSENFFKLNTEYAGAMALLLGVLAIVYRPRPWRIFWGAIAVLAAAYSMGAHLPVWHLAYHLIPMVNKFRAASMMMFWFSFGTSLLAALFMRDIMSGEPAQLDDNSRRKWQRGLLIAMGALTLLAAVFSSMGFVRSLMSPLVETLADPKKERIFELNFTKNFVPMLWLWWVFAIAALGLLLGVVSGKVKPAMFVGAVLLIGLVDTIRVNSGFIKPVSPRPYFHTEQSVADLAKKVPEEPFRVFPLPGTFQQNAEGVHGLESVSGFHDNELRWYRSFRGDQQNSNYFHGLLGQRDGRPFLIAERLQTGNNFLNLANVEYVLARQSGKMNVIRNRGALGRVSFVPHYRVMDTSEVARSLREGGYDITTTVALLEEPAQKPGGSTSPDSSTLMRPLVVDWKDYTPDYRRVRVRAPYDGWLRVSEVFYPGWEIRIDGEQRKVYQADLAWMATPIAEGEHTVEMIPRSMYAANAAIVSAICIVAMLAYWGYCLWRRQRKMHAGASG